MKNLGPPDSSTVQKYSPNAVPVACSSIGKNTIHYPLFREAPGHNRSGTQYQENVTGEGQCLYHHARVNEVRRGL